MTEQISTEYELRTANEEGSQTQIPTTMRGTAEVPALGCGTYQMSSNECFAALRTALSMGYRHIDTAMAYDNEAAVGRAIDVADVDRDEVFLTTKVKGYPEYLNYDAFIKEAQECAERLGTSYIDLLLVHWWHPEGDMEATCAALDRLVDEGVVRHIGVSNFSIDRLQRAMDYLATPIRTNQVEYHAYRPRDELLSFCRENDIFITAYSPLGEGHIASDNVLAAIGSSYNKTAAQVAIRWLIQQEGVVTIPKATSKAHLQENMQVFDFELTPGEMREIADHNAPLSYRLTAEGGPIHRARHRAGQVIPEWIRTRIP